MFNMLNPTSLWRFLMKTAIMFYILTLVWRATSDLRTMGNESYTGEYVINTGYPCLKANIFRRTITVILQIRLEEHCIRHISHRLSYRNVFQTKNNWPVIIVFNMIPSRTEFVLFQLCLSTLEVLVYHAIFSLPKPCFPVVPWSFVRRFAESHCRLSYLRRVYCSPYDWSCSGKTAKLKEHTRFKFRVFPWDFVCRCTSWCP